MVSNTKSPFARFMYMNGIQRKEIADYLGTSLQYISMLCKGERIPSRIYKLIIDNDRGWDSTALTESVTDQSVTQTNTNGDNILSAGQSDVVASLREQIKMKDEQINSLLVIISNLSK